MSAPGVSVVIPTRNRPDSLRSAVASVRAQTLESWELLVVDDGSSPPAQTAIRDLLDSEPRMRLLRLDRSHGAAAARNEGLAVAGGALVAFLDDDDVWDSSFLATMSAALSAGDGADVAYCALRYLHPAGGETVLPLPDLTGRDDPLSILVRGSFIGTPCVLARREAIEAAGGFDPALPRLQDWDLWLRMSRTSRFLRVDAPLVRVGMPDDRISTSTDRLVAACAMLAEHRPGELGLTRRQRGDFLYTLATVLMVSGARTAALPYFFRALLDRPGVPRRWAAAGIAAVAPALYRAVTRTREAREATR